jgi:hypothetical protein
MDANKLIDIYKQLKGNKNKENVDIKLIYLFENPIQQIINEDII